MLAVRADSPVTNCGPVAARHRDIGARSFLAATSDPAATTRHARIGAPSRDRLGSRPCIWTCSTCAPSTTAPSSAARRSALLQEAPARPLARHPRPAIVGYGFAAPMLRPFLADAAPRPRADAGPQGVMPWPAGEPNSLRPRRGDPLADRGRHRRPAHRRPRPRDLRQPRGAPRRDLARPRPRRPRRSSSSPTAPASGPAATSPPSATAAPTASASSRPCSAPTASPPSATPPPSTRRRSHRKFLLQTAYFWERLGRRFEPRVIAGALLVEASKQVYARPPSSGSQGRRARPPRRPRRPHPARARARPRPRPPRARLAPRRLHAAERVDLKPVSQLHHSAASTSCRPRTAC